MDIKLKSDNWVSTFLNLQFSIFNPQLFIIIFQSSIFNPQSSIINYQSSIINLQFSILNPQFNQGVPKEVPERIK